ncbi:alpha/beta fold hydrolase [Streptomyces sp. SID8379]|uniref:alpha/beta fold hydrolase n=1 Tax=unclassified Streptomyces TaxID=2593676 RepID=UPI0003794AC5|nr:MULTISPECIES: alpha/beta hydrolase [unclassified Streptomyces]MYW64112.1 alpha/beta fold hydrolase [Streptomyces sp. SID8379]
MKLHTREWGSGDRVALLVHGIMSDHRTWRRVGPALAERGYRVIAVDLRGHGGSGRGPYSAELFADDLVETLPAGAELALGHSLGGMALSLAAERLAPRRAVYADPAWALGAMPVDPALFMEFRDASRQMIANLNPRWEDADIDVELATLAAWDPRTALAVGGEHAIDRTPERPVVPSLVQAADPSFLLSDELKEDLVRRGFEVRTVKGAGHTIHRDDFDGFMESLEGWL